MISKFRKCTDDDLLNLRKSEIQVLIRCLRFA